MATPDLKTMSVDELVELFAQIGVAQGKAIREGVLPPEEPSLEMEREAAQKKFEKLYWEMDAVDRELRARGREARSALMQLYDYPNMQVKLMAARHTLGVAYEAAREMIEAIADSKWPGQSLDAGMTICNLDNGTFKPD
ncbi:MAG TPA: DUF2019 domain-containing protein [Stellaceae bacterium]|nr:DUF2019 domain-containing protein [Stellaceae bacterium]